MLNQDLLKILACPNCKGPVKYEGDDKGLSCGKCLLLYPIKDGIPVMLVDEAQKISSQDQE